MFEQSENLKAELMIESLTLGIPTRLFTPDEIRQIRENTEELEWNQLNGKRKREGDNNRKVLYAIYERARKRYESEQRRNHGKDPSEPVRC